MPKKEVSAFFESTRLKSFISDTGLPLNVAPSALSLSSKDFLDWWSDRQPNLVKRRNLISVAQYLDINEDDILSGRYDRSLVRARIYETAKALPEKYAMNSYSHVRTSAHIIKYVAMLRGQHVCDNLMRKLNVSPQIYDNLDNKISLQYFIDLLDLLETDGFSPHEMDILACVMFLGLKDTPLGEKFKHVKSHYDCYKVVTENICKFDDNFVYQIDLFDDCYRMTSTLNFDHFVKTSFNRKQLGKLFRYRQILTGWFPYLAGLSPVIPENKVLYFNDRAVATTIVRFDQKPTSPLYLIGGGPLTLPSF